MEQTGESGTETVIADFAEVHGFRGKLGGAGMIGLHNAISCEPCVEVGRKYFESRIARKYTDFAKVWVVEI